MPWCAGSWLSRQRLMRPVHPPHASVRGGRAVGEAVCEPASAPPPSTTTSRTRLRSPTPLRSPTWSVEPAVRSPCQDSAMPQHELFKAKQSWRGQGESLQGLVGGDAHADRCAAVSGASLPASQRVRSLAVPRRETDPPSRGLAGLRAVWWMESVRFLRAGAKITWDRVGLG